MSAINHSEEELRLLNMIIALEVRVRQLEERVRKLGELTAGFERMG